MEYARTHKDHDRRIAHKVEEYGVLPILPKQYGYAGGAARYLLELHLGWNPQPPRDIDLVFFGDNESRDMSFEKKINPHDSADNHYAAILEKDYFDTRDFTCSQVLVVGNKLFVKPSTIKDMQDHCIRLCWHERVKLMSGMYPTKMLIKSLYMAAKMELETGQKDWKSVDIETILEITQGHIYPFWIAVFLDRVYSLDPLTATGRFIALLHRYHIVPMDVKTVGEIVLWLQPQMHSFTYRYIPQHSPSFSDNQFADILDESANPAAHQLEHEFGKYPFQLSHKK
jgi:hypothetical protein